MHVDSNVDSLLDLGNLFRCLVIAHVGNVVAHFERRSSHRHSCHESVACSSVDRHAKEFLKPEDGVSAIWRDKMNRLFFCLGRIDIVGEFRHRKSLCNAYSSTFLCNGWLHSCPDDVVDGEFVAKDDCLVVVDIYYSSKTLIVQAEEIEEGAILAELIVVVGIVETCNTITKEQEQTASHCLLDAGSASLIDFF